MPEQQRNAPRPIGEVIERWLATLDGPARLDAFHQMPSAMQAGAWAGLRAEVERGRERGA